MCIQTNTYKYKSIHTCSCTSKKRLPQNALSSRWYPPRSLRVVSYAVLLQMRVAFQATSWSPLRSNSALPSALSLPSAARCTALRIWDAFRRGNVSVSHRRDFGHVHTLHVCGPEPQKASASGWSPRTGPSPSPSTPAGARRRRPPRNFTRPMAMPMSPRAARWPPIRWRAPFRAGARP